MPSLRATFTFPQSLGIMGGKPGASTYLVGVQDDQALYLDPHETQQVYRYLPKLTLILPVLPPFLVISRSAYIGFCR